jgi:hypothetical protein
MAHESKDCSSPPTYGEMRTAGGVSSIVVVPEDKPF